MSNDLFKRNCAVLAQWYAGECKEELQMETVHGFVPCQYNALINAYNTYEYRIKPRTITVNGIEVPEPVRQPLMDGQKYFTVTVTNPSSLVNSARWNDDKVDNHSLNLGLIHLTREAAQLHAEAMIQPSKRME